MSPTEITILLHYYAKDGDYPITQADDLRRRDQTYDLLVGEQLLARVSLDTGQSYRLTERGLAYVQSLIAVPLPEARWITVWPTP